MPRSHKMRVLFRADASVEIGSGHVTRCTTLARALAAAGHQAEFICRDVPGNLIDWIEVQGFGVLRLAQSAATVEDEDATRCRGAIGGAHYDWLVVDHFGLGATWERTAAPVADRILVLDDLGRAHDCDLLLDQNLENPAHALYSDRVGRRCILLLGPEFALVRPEFAKLRARSINRVRESVDRLLVFMSGSDPTNETSKVLAGFSEAGRGAPMIDVVIGAGNPHRDEVEAMCGRLASATLHVQTPRMAELVAAADCAIGSGGSASWERCVLGLPALVTILADNQADVATAVGEAGAHRVLGWHHQLSASDYAAALDELDGDALRQMSARAAAICDGHGAERVAERLTRA